MSDEHQRSAANTAPVLAAAMLAVGEIIEPEKTHVEIVGELAGEPFEDELDLEFGLLPPLD
ncbi:MAG: hypothetical protein GY773_34570 [Actinomycetia bacterium]|nr:hypothetical protein [Actinomycetes bacterium]